MRKNVIAFTLLAAVGCGPRVTFEDDVDLTLDFFQLLGPSSHMNTPYVTGSSMNVWILSSDEGERMNGWTVESSDPSVFSVGPPMRDSDHRLYVRGTSGKEGRAILTVRSRDGAQASHDVEVRAPDRAELMAHGLLLIGRSEKDSRVAEARLLDGGTSTFLVHYYKGAERLNGNGALRVAAPTAVTVATPRTFLFEDRDWLQVTPNMVGQSALALSAGDVKISDVPLVVVDPDEIMDVAILGEDESRARNDEWLVALAQAYDAEGRAVYGVEYKWELDGLTQAGFGDIFRYKFDPDLKKTLCARFGTMEAMATIHAARGFVGSSNRLGCGAAPGAPDSSTAAWWTALLAAWILRRKIARSPS